MKNIKIFILTVVYCLALLSSEAAGKQPPTQIVLLGAKASISLPKTAKTLTKEQVSLKTQGRRWGINEKARGTIYQLDDIMIKLNYKYVAVKPDFLNKEYKSYQFAVKGLPQFEVMMKTYNKRPVLLVRSDIIDAPGRLYYTFKLVNDMNDIIVGGRIEYDKTDAIKAEKLLADMLNSIRFKE